MNSADIALVRDDAAQLAEVGDEFAVEFYATLFEVDPDARPLFPVDMAAQRQKLVDEIDALVDLAVSIRAADRDGFDERAGALGRRHADYGATAHHYAAVGEALLAALEVTVAGWDDDHRGAWTSLYRVVAEAMTVT